MTSRARPKVLLVEGKEDLLTLAELMEACGIPWPTNAPPIHIEIAGGIDRLLQPQTIETQLKSSGIEALGILVDADDDAEQRWQQLRRLLALSKRGGQPRYPDLPEALPPGGLVHEGPSNPRIGVWIMPDNVSNGMLETMLARLRRSAPALIEHARSATEEARARGAPWRDVHRDKAELHTWLAWQDPPGEQVHGAVRSKVLVPDPEITEPFLRWICALFRIARPGALSDPQSQ